MKAQTSNLAMNRRALLQALPLAGVALAGESWLGSSALAQDSVPESVALPEIQIDEHYPSQAPELVREMVGVAHGNVARVRELLAERPSLARASWDWGWGDWESALGAASHVGNREIAELLLAHGARPTLFSAAMLGQLAVVKAFIEARPGVQRSRGPHGINLMSHARAGKEPASSVRAYLETLGDADPKYPLVPLPDGEAARWQGSYQIGPGERSRLVVTEQDGGFRVERPGEASRVLTHLGELEFFPAGAEAVRLRFAALADGGAELVVEDGGTRLVARRSKL